MKIKTDNGTLISMLLLFIFLIMINWFTLSIQSRHINQEQLRQQQDINFICTQLSVMQDNQIANHEEYVRKWGLQNDFILDFYVELRDQNQDMTDKIGLISRNLYKHISRLEVKLDKILERQQTLHYQTRIKLGVNLLEEINHARQFSKRLKEVEEHIQFIMAQAQSLRDNQFIIWDDNIRRFEILQENTRQKSFDEIMDMSEDFWEEAFEEVEE